ncbi:MAG: permease, partial [Acidimicrobiia bacterium]|nr:permease [Acidimicrobiia bacterium]
MMFGSAASLLAELVILFFCVAFLVDLFQRRAGGDRIRSWIGGRPVVAALKGITIGFVTPFCTYSAIPMLVGLRRAGVTAAGYVAFIVAAPVLDPVLFGALLLIVGPGAAAVYVAVAFIAAMALALVADRAGIERFLKPLPAAPVLAVSAASRRSRGPETGCDNVGCGVPADSTAWGGWRTRA